jgi:TRAP-type C4-dicarboxylate transport system substrate-binding protein
MVSSGNKKEVTTVKKLLLTCLIVVLCGSFFLISCTEEAAPAPETTPAPEPEAAPVPEKIEIVFTDNAPPTAGGNVLMHEGYVPRLKEMLGPLGDRIEFIWYHSESLFPYADQVDAVQRGAADMCTWVNSYELARCPLNNFTDLPFMGWQSPGIATSVWDAVSYSLPEVADEYSDFEIIGRWCGLSRVIATNFEAKVPADFKGKKILASGATADLLQSIGASPMQQPPSEWYTSLDRGLADGIASGYFMFNMFDIAEVTDYALDFPSGDLSISGQNWVMNKEKFHSLPLEMQGAMKELRPWLTTSMVAVESADKTNGLQAFLDSGGTLYNLTPEEEQEWLDAGAPMRDEWIADMEAKGLPGQKVYDEVIKWLNIYRKGTP